ncbi:MAG: NACHT domain-containing protein, partial [Limnothrix sp.]
MGIAEAAFSLIINLVSSVIYDILSPLDFFQKRKIEKQVEDAVADVVEPLLPFLQREGVKKDKQERLILICVEEIQPLVENPEYFFSNSLNGQKVFEDLYKDRELPQTIVEDGLKDTYALLCPRILTLLCEIPVALKKWETLSWQENYKRLDEISAQLKGLFEKVDELSNANNADDLLVAVRKTASQKIRLQLDLTGLRSETPQSGKFDDFFVHPQLGEIKKDNSLFQIIDTADDSFSCLTSFNQRSVLIGQPGSGKSTFTTWLQREIFSPKSQDLCVRTELRRFANESLPSVQELVRELGGKHLAEDLTSEKINQWVANGQIVFILDGFDEIVPEHRDETFDWILELSTYAEKCPFILTSRPLTTNHLERFNNSWNLWNINPFDRQRIIDYIQRWYKYSPLLEDGNKEIEPVELAEDWLRDPTIRPLTGNPLLLSTLLTVHHLDGSLPSGRSELYRRYVEGMLGLWDDRRKVKATTLNISRETKRQIIRSLALEMFLEEKDQLDEDDAVKLLSKILGKLKIDCSAKAILTVFCERSGLIIGPGIYSFIHKSVLEYLVAESVLQGDQEDHSGGRIDRFWLYENSNNDRWNTVMFLWAGLASVSDVESVIKKCMKAPTEYSLGLGLLLDQSSKFRIDIRRNLALLIVANQKTQQDKSFWSYTNLFLLDSFFENKLLLPNLRLRSITLRTPSLLQFILEMLENGTLKYEDLYLTNGYLYQLFW